MGSGIRQILAASAALSALVPAAVAVAADLCTQLENAGIDVERRLTTDYTTDLLHYWSAACSDLKPTCQLAPSSAQEVADIIVALQGTDDLFAVKSGGHMPNNGFASIQDGLLVLTKNLNDVIYDADTQTAVVGPGQSWEEAQNKLDSAVTGRALVGGRLGGVGVGGYILGAGLSFLSSQYGWAANNVINYEVVLANGTIVNANTNENSDLFAALKGGGNNFGIVTAYTLQTHPMDHKVWGGNYIFTATEDTTAQILAAIHDFTENYPDEKAAIIATTDHTLLLNLWILFLFYDGPTPPQGVFGSFKAIGPGIDTTKTWDTYYDLLKNNDQYILHGQRYTIATETTPLPNKTVSLDVLQSYYDHWFNVTKTVLGVTNVISSFAFQPMPTAITSQAQSLGGDLLNLPADQNYIFFEFDFSYAFASDDETIDAAIQNVYAGMNNLVLEHIEHGLVPDVYRPLFMNDAYYRQDYWGRIGTKQEALQTRLKYDPDGFFQNRTSGGFRLS